MELGLSLGDYKPKPLKVYVDAHHQPLQLKMEVDDHRDDHDLGLICLGLGPNLISCKSQKEQKRCSSDPTVLQLGFPWISDKLLSGPGRRLDVKPVSPPALEADEDGAAHSSPYSTVSSFQLDLSMYRSERCRRKRDLETMSSTLNEVDQNSCDQTRRGGCASSSRVSDQELSEENGLTRKKLRLSKQQSAFLEESFKEHDTLNPKQKLTLAKKLNLRPRQVEVWFQNRRARTKLKQTEVDCEYLKRCCETLTQDSRRLQKELQDLRALKTSQPFYMQPPPATRLTMCPSCERKTTTTTTAPTNVNTRISLSLPLATTVQHLAPLLNLDCTRPLTTSKSHAQEAGL